MPLSKIQQEELEKFDEQFSAYKIWVVPSSDNQQTISDMRSFLSSAISRAYEEGQSDTLRKVGEVTKKCLRAWIQGNIIIFEKPTYESAFFDAEEVVVLDADLTAKLQSLLGNK